MYPYTEYYIKVREGDSKKTISDLIGGEFSAIEAINKFMQIHFPDNRAYLPLEIEPLMDIDGRVHKSMSVDTDIGRANKLRVVYEDE